MTHYENAASMDIEWAKDGETGQRKLRHPSEGRRFDDGAILVAEMTDPDWLPIMKRAAAIVTDHGGRTSHAAIVSREMGLPAIVGTGSNDLTQLVLGVDRDSEALAPLFDERDEAVTTMIRDVIERAHRCGREVGLCGQAPSDHPDFARLLVEAGIDSISVTPDGFVGVKQHAAAAEAAQHPRAA